VEARGQGRDVSRDSLTFDVVRGDGASLAVVFPKKERNFVYPYQGR
jgi:hypothetical protein